VSSFVEHITRNDMEQSTYIWIEVVVMKFLRSVRHFFAVFYVFHNDDSNP